MSLVCSIYWAMDLKIWFRLNLPKPTKYSDSCLKSSFLQLGLCSNVHRASSIKGNMNKLKNSMNKLIDCNLIILTDSNIIQHVFGRWKSRHFFVIGPIKRLIWILSLLVPGWRSGTRSQCNVNTRQLLNSFKELFSSTRDVHMHTHCVGINICLIKTSNQPRGAMK